MLPTINPIIDLFTKQTLSSRLDGSDSFIFYLELAGLFLVILLTAFVYLKNKNKDSFDITLDGGQVVTIKKKEAEQIFNTLNKIKAKESEN